MKTANQRFDSKINKNGPLGQFLAPQTPCWLWTAAQDSCGYGVFCLGTGIRNFSAKLTDQQIVSIRKDDRTQKEIAFDYGVSQTQINKIKNRKHWKHVK